MRSTDWMVVAIISLLFPFSVTAGDVFEVHRLNNNQPILSAATFAAAGATPREAANINGPSVIRIPDWIPPAERADPSAVYYLYFAHHSGGYIRLAWAPRITGPWKLHNTGANIPQGERGVLDIRSKHGIKVGNSLAIWGHVASPDVHVDHENQRLIMYFHAYASYEGKTARAKQKSLVATSRLGLDFSRDIKPVILGPFYFRVFNVQDKLYALARDRLFQPVASDKPWAPTGDTPGSTNLWTETETSLFQMTPGLFSPAGDRVIDPVTGKSRVRVRHVSLLKSGKTLHIFYTARGHAPERILLTSVDLSREDWQTATPESPPVEILRPEYPWEGSEAPLVPSRKGIARGLHNQLRDPFVFSDEDKLYLFYVGGGEQGIGLAQLVKVGS